MWGRRSTWPTRCRAEHRSRASTSTTAVYEVMRDSRQFASAGTITVDGDRAADLAAVGAAVMTSAARCIVVLLGHRRGDRPAGLRWCSHRAAARAWLGAAASWRGRSTCCATTSLPLGALLILLVKGTQVSAEATPVRMVATVFGFVVLVLLLSGLNATLFQGAPEGSWRKRIPSIFLDVARFALIAVGVGGDLLLSSGAPTSAGCSPRWVSRRSSSGWRCRTPSGRSSRACSCCSSSRSSSATGSTRRRRVAGWSK